MFDECVLLANSETKTVVHVNKSFASVFLEEKTLDHDISTTIRTRQLYCDNILGILNNNAVLLTLPSLHGRAIRVRKTSHVISFENASYLVYFISTSSPDTDLRVDEESDLQVQNQKLRDENEALQKQVESVDTLKKTFLHNIGHEIRTPMNAIVGFADLLEETLDDHTKLKEFTSIIKQRSSDLLNIINDILEVSKLESGLVPIQNDEFAINSLMLDIKNSIEASYSKKIEQGVSFVYHPPDDSKLVITSDPYKIKQVFIKLLVNAFKHTTAGIVSLGFGKVENAYEFYVEDSGVGIEASNLNTIFDNFVQLNNSTTQKKSGQGLGLSIARGYVELLGGTMKVESQPGIGSRFSFRIPEKPSEGTSPGINRDFVISPEKLTGKKILVVDDDPNNTMYINKLLADIGIESKNITTRKPAVDELTRGESFDLIFLDLQADCIETTRLIKEMNPKSSIILQTSSTDKAVKAKARQMGCSDVIVKPVKKHELLSLIAINLLT